MPPGAGSLSSVVEAIGRTPLVELARMTGGLDGRLLAKLEFLNPGGSKKDRIARQIVEEAERSGELRPGQTLVELTSGNTGTGLAVVCAVKKYPFVAVMSRGNSNERARMMRALGAEVVLVDQAPESVPGAVSGEDIALVEAATAEIAEQRGGFRVDQFRRAGNSRAHELAAEEVWAQAGGCVDAFCDFVGTGGTLAGVARVLKTRKPRICCYAIEPTDAEALAGHDVVRPGHRIQGGGYGMPELPLLDRSLVDGTLAVSDEEAITAARRLAREEGILAGFSSGANAAAALRLLQGAHRGQTVVILLADSGMKYLSTDLWPD
ncbi:MAG: cysteine synthase family protein [Thermoleophilia bacterium]|nr:cysteine synthase family protein [Thermoleophilia bacterium]